MIIDGKSIANEIKNEIKNEISQLKKENVIPGLAMIIVGENSASKIYVNNKKKSCLEVGIWSKEYFFPENTSQKEIIELIKKLNHDESIHGILVQLPLPHQIDEFSVSCAIDPQKDVDAFTPSNMGKAMLGKSNLLPCTPAGIIEMLNHKKISPKGKNCVIIGRSNIVGKPAAFLLTQQDATVTLCHSKTKNLSEICKNADILICAVGKPKFVTTEMVKKGSVVIDVGINRDKDNKVCGDVEFEAVKKVASFITPVPGGVGPMTVAMLLKNTLEAAKLQKSKK